MLVHILILLRILIPDITLIPCLSFQKQRNLLTLSLSLSLFLFLSFSKSPSWKLNVPHLWVQLPFSSLSLSLSLTTSLSLPLSQTTHYLSSLPLSHTHYLSLNTPLSLPLSHTHYLPFYRSVFLCEGCDETMLRKANEVKHYFLHSVFRQPQARSFRQTKTLLFQLENVTTLCALTFTVTTV